MLDYMNYSDASEDDIDYDDCEENDLSSTNENATTDGSNSAEKV